ncbi:MAG: hydroxymethylpyrimidine/phosphomethylpyrimidine kinase [Betaproteobacteria bacterium]|nr:hydroxymethylpyrimidine/phosphomethylpyrimidine kinase [Betaproteobacteria bacterium]
MPPNPPAVLVFAASDPVCGAGLQADILTLSALGCQPLTVVTALTAQDTTGVEAVLPVAADFVRQQLHCLAADIAIAAIKVGLLGNADHARIAADAAMKLKVPLVLDPVLASGRGDKLADESLREALLAILLPHTELITPNIPEAYALFPEMPPDAPLPQLAQRMIARGARHVLITGAHAPTPEVINTLYSAEGKIRADHWPRLANSYHGSGCTLASAVAAFLARGYDMEAAVYEAQCYVSQTLRHAHHPGRGQAIPNRLFALPLP